MGIAWCLSIYFVSWWLVFFIVLPFGVRSHAEQGAAHIPGCEPAAPFQPRLRRKVIITSLITAVLVGAMWLGFYLNLIQVPNLN